MSRYEEDENGRIRIVVGRNQAMGHKYYSAEFKTGVHRDKKKEPKGNRSQRIAKAIREETE